MNHSTNHSLSKVTSAVLNESQTNFQQEYAQLSVSGKVYFTCFIYACVFTIGLFGNACVIYIILKFPKMKTVTNFYIFNLALADIMFLIGIPVLMTTILSNNWPFGNLVCKLYWITANSNQYVSSIFYLVLSGDRFVAVYYALTAARKYRSPFIAKCVCAGIWMFAMVLMIPVMKYARQVYLGINPRTKKPLYSCQVIWPNPRNSKLLSRFGGTLDANKIFTIYTFLFSYGIPVLFTSIFYLLVLVKMKKSGLKLDYGKVGNNGQGSSLGKRIRKTLQIRDKGYGKYLPPNIRISKPSLGPISFYKEFSETNAPTSGRMMYDKARLGLRLKTRNKSKINLNSSPTRYENASIISQTSPPPDNSRRIIISTNDCNNIGDTIVSEHSSADAPKPQIIVNANSDFPLSLNSSPGGSGALELDMTSKGIKFIGNNLATQCTPLMVTRFLTTPESTNTKTHVSGTNKPPDVHSNRIRKSTMHERKKQNIRRLTLMVMTIIAVYVFCWTPYWIFQLCISFSNNMAPSYVIYVAFIIYCLAFANSSMNPVLYAFLSENFKTGFIETFKRPIEYLRSLDKFKIMQTKPKL